ncbi:type I restriction endonuclease subunit R [Gemmatimonadota bacterium]
MSFSFSGEYGENPLVEQPSIQLFGDLGWDALQLFNEFDSGSSTVGRETKSEVVLTSRLRPVLARLNPELTNDALDEAVEELTRDRSRLSLTRANEEVYDLLKNGVRVEFQDPEHGGARVERVRLIDWDEPTNNDFLLASQLWVTGEMYTRRPDLVGFVNGIPLVLVELKASHVPAKQGYDNNLTDYRDTIPQLFWYNALVIVSNGSESKVGSVSAAWEHFTDWKKINSEGEEGVISLETMVRGTCEPTRLLDLVENYTLFMETHGGVIKLFAKNHQYLGVGNALEALEDIKAREGRLGVFWHTQGSGKSVSMIFFAQRVLRKVPGNWTFVIVTDRLELDEQIYRNFANCGVVTEAKAQATSAANLRKLLGEDHRYVFTLIHKFRTERGEVHPVLSERSDIIVFTDEAHRSQYDTLALNMRTALPNASFLAFTGTPLIAGEERTRDVFGDYISVYNFRQSIEDKATVPLYYENRIPELQLTNENFSDELEEVLESAELDEAQERKLESEFGREYHLVTREDRLDKVAEDLVAHFMGRGHLGKAMMISIDKATAVRMYDRVSEHWGRYRDDLAARMAGAQGDEERDLQAVIDYMNETDMAVIVSQAQNEIQGMQAKGLDIKPHRQRIVSEALDEKFKDPEDPLRLVFVCAMWLTGFDAPACSTIYLDKPMKNHTLMQTIARANRVFGEKVNGLIVDYVGVFRSLQRALAIYGTGSGGGVGEGDMPVQDKSVLVEHLRAAITDTIEFCEPHGVDFDVIRSAEGFERIKALDDAVEALLVNEDTKRGFIGRTGRVEALFKAILPDTAANELAPIRAAIRAVDLKLRAPGEPVDISMVTSQVEALLDRSVAAEGYIIREVPDAGDEYRIDLSKIDFEALAKRFEKGKARTQAERLKALLERKLDVMVRQNRTRHDLLERFEKMIDDYNAGIISAEEFLERLSQFAKDLTEEERRGISENLSEEELAVLDLLLKPSVDLTKDERESVKGVAHELIETLRREKLILDWRKKQQSRAAVRLTIEETLDRLPEAFDKTLYEQKCDLVYQHVYESYFGAGESVYGSAA